MNTFVIERLYLLEEYFTEFLFSWDDEKSLVLIKI